MKKYLNDNFLQSEYLKWRETFSETIHRKKLSKLEVVKEFHKHIKEQDDHASHVEKHDTIDLEQSFKYIEKRIMANDSNLEAIVNEAIQLGSKSLDLKESNKKKYYDVLYEHAESFLSTKKLLDAKKEQEAAELKEKQATAKRKKEQEQAKMKKQQEELELKQKEEKMLKEKQEQETALKKEQEEKALAEAKLKEQQKE